MTAITPKLVQEWPAALAVIVLIGGHLWLSIVEGHQLRPIGIPLFAAATIFILGELVRKIV